MNIESVDYDRQSLPVKVLHLGLGRFHRAHFAFYLEELMRKEGHSWGICGVSFRSRSAIASLERNDFKYHIEVHGDEGGENRILEVGVLKEAIFALEEPETLLVKFADPEIEVISLTVTEKGYYYNAQEQGLIKDHADILEDLKSEVPQTTVGWLYSGLKKRQKAGGGGVTLLSCDNLPDNGKVLRRVLEDFVELNGDDEFLTWIKDNVKFPCSMVDRIVPSVSFEQINEFEDRVGFLDEGYISTESFTQWVIEDSFSHTRPTWDKVGVEFVEEAKPFEEMKLRLLNGSHSLMAYYAQICGHQTVDQAASDPKIEALLRTLMLEESGATLQLPQGYSVEKYADELLKRFKNKSLNHELAQIAMDGSQKIPQRFLQPIDLLKKQGKSYETLSLALASWFYYYFHGLKGDTRFRVSDPMNETLEKSFKSFQMANEAWRVLYSESEISIFELFRKIGLGEDVKGHLEAWTES